MFDISLVNPYIRVCMNSVIPAHHEIKRRIILDYELIYIADGEFVLTYDQVDYACKKGQFIFLRPNVPHQLSEINKDLTQPHIHFDITHMHNSADVPVSFKDISAMSEHEKGWIRNDIFSGYPKMPFVAFSDKERALELFFEIINNETSVLTKKAKLVLLLEMLINDNFPNILKQQNIIYHVEEYVKNFIDAGQGLSASLEDFSKQFNYSKYYIEHCFKKRYGIGVVAYKNERRIQSAKELLKSNSVSQVSEKLGFSSIYAFSRAFKNRFGISPANMKKAQ